ncbi:MAG TPA: hypothetical protein VN957_08570 [Chthoniobacterales bacterium]|nr:hypothetical protein [Chthoniobacterales bacterium]
MRIAFVALSAPGHLNPTTALARQLQSRDHDVIVISLPDAEPYVRAAGLAFLPYCENVYSLHFDYSGYTPLCMYDWPHETTPAALARNRKGVANLTQMLKQANAGVRGYAERAGLKIDWDNPSATISELGWITQTPKEFDFESSHWPTQFRHTGPFHDGNGRIDVDFPWERLTGELSSTRRWEQCRLVWQMFSTRLRQRPRSGKAFNWCFPLATLSTPSRSGRFRLMQSS